MTIGASHHFLRTFKKSQNSLIIEILLMENPLFLRGNFKGALHYSRWYSFLCLKIGSHNLSCLMWLFFLESNSYSHFSQILYLKSPYHTILSGDQSE